MKIFVKTRPNAKNNSVEKINETHYLAKVAAPAKQGKANQKLIELLANYFKTAKSNIKIVIGQQTSNKIIEINY